MDLRKFHGCSGSESKWHKTPTKSYSKAFDSWNSTHCRGWKAWWKKKAGFISTSFIQKRNFSSGWHKHDSRNLKWGFFSWISCYQACGVKNICKFPFVCFSVFLFLTVSSAKTVILRFSCAKILGYKTHPKFSTNFPPKDRIFFKKPCAL